MCGGGFVQQCLLGLQGSSYGGSEVWVEGLCSKEGAFRIKTKCALPLGTAAPLSCFGIFKRTNNFLSSHDPEARHTWLPPTPNSDVWHHPNCLLHHLHLPPLQPYGGRTPGLDLSVSNLGARQPPSTPSQHSFPLHLHYRSPRC